MTEVFHIERFATHDGPGIRTTVFFRGCGMHCPWCANPESWRSSGSLLHHGTRCTGCGRCASLCPAHAIRLEPKWSCDRNACTGCGQCVQECTHDALDLISRSMSTSEILQEVLKDRDYYEQSHGGLTISGGEPFLQPEGLLDLLSRASYLGLHTAVETAGFYDRAVLKQALPLVDLFLFDLKHTDPDTLRRITGGEWAAIESNLQLLAESCPERVIIRVPVIPGFNQDDDSMHAILSLAAGMGFQRVDLLPYHVLAKAKWEMLGGSSLWQYPSPLHEEDLLGCRRIGESLGMEMRIGG